MDVAAWRQRRRGNNIAQPQHDARRSDAFQANIFCRYQRLLSRRAVCAPRQQAAAASGAKHGGGGVAGVRRGGGSRHQFGIGL
jgi:hypothetical protein